MSREWLNRREHALMYCQEWRPFHPDAIVQVRSAYWPDVHDNIGPAKDFWWGYEEEGRGIIGEGVIVAARRLDRPKTQQGAPV